jgi:serine/threonine-protein kinase
MELLEGTDLRRLLASRGRLGVPDACELIAQACAGLAVAHRHGVIHRDLKPENLFLTQRGTRALLKVLDFGIAKLRNQSLGTASGSLLGTPEYMPPEQVRGGAAIDERADLYALGAILYELLTGRLPHPGEEQHEIISHVLFEPPLPLLELRPELPTELACIVHRALAPDPDERFRSVGELAEALAAYARPETLLPIEGLDTAETVTPPARASESRVATQAVQRSTKPKRVYAALLSLTALAAVFAYRLQRTAAPQVRQLPAISIQSAPHVAASLKLPLHSLTSAGDVASMEPTAVAVERPAPAAEQPKPPIMRARRPERPRASPAVLSPSGPPSTIEVLRGERTIIFKRDNPLRSD